jgi:hypothetical protein
MRGCIYYALQGLRGPRSECPRCSLAIHRLFDLESNAWFGGSEMVSSVRELYLGSLNDGATVERVLRDENVRRHMISGGSPRGEGTLERRGEVY